MQQNRFSVVRLITTLCVSVFVLSGCITDDDEVNTAQSIVDNDVVEMSLSGSVGDGPVVNGRVVLRNAINEVVALQTSDEFAQYNMQFGVSSSDFPLIITVNDGTDLVTGTALDFPLIAAISAPSDGQVANLNPMGTLVIKVAQRMDGGISAANLADATQAVHTVMNFGLDTAQFPDFISTDVNDENVASVVRASEAFGEAIRRTHNAMISAGVTSAEEVLDALSADLVDGILDGRGGAGVDPRITVVNNIVSAQVVLETLANRLKVGGVDATDRLDLAIRRVTPGNPSVALTDSIGVTDEILLQAKVLLDAAILADSNPELVSLRQAIDLVEPGQSQQDLPIQLKSNLSDELVATVQQISTAPVQVIDQVNDAVRDGFDVVNNDINQAPTIAGNPTTEIVMDTPYDFSPFASDQDGDVLTFSISGKPSWASFDSATGRLSGIPGENDLSSSSVIRITVSDGVATATLPAFSTTVMLVVDQPVNRAPTISGLADSLVHVGSPYTFTPIATDPDADELTFWISGKPSWAGFNATTGLLSGTPGVDDVGTYSGINISVSDASGAIAVLPLFSLTVAIDGVPNRAPTISGTPATQVTADSPYSFTPTASDPDNNPLTFSISGKPSWASFNAVTGLLTGTPTAAGTWSDIWITVSDGSSSSTLPSFAITVIGLPNRAPSISGSAVTEVNVGSLYSFTPVASDPDNDPLTFMITGKPSWASFNSGTGRLSGTPGNVGTFSDIRISVMDDSGTVAALPVFSITATNEVIPNRTPTISGTSSTQVTIGSSYSFTPTASDPDNDLLSFSITGKPSWASFNSGTGRLSGTPNNTGTNSNIRISVTDGSASASLAAFSITVIDLPNRAPTISGAPVAAVNVGSSYSFTPTASDPDNDNLTFSISGKPTWASFNAGSGRLSGTPGNSGTYSSIQISVSDGSANASLAAFSITVNDLPNRAPTISGTPAAEVMVDASYSFTPTASDPDNNPLTFFISGKPTWANFDSSTGRLSGTPGAGYVGTWSGIGISVSDGVDSVSLGNFSIEVIAQALGSATLFWTAPTLNEDGSTLTDLAGFKLYYGTATDSMNTIETIDNSSVTTFLVENLHAGTWYFKVTAFDGTGNESADSDLGSKLIGP